MSHDIIMPVLGMNQDTGIIAEWLKKPGEWVASGDVVMAVETDKAVQDIESRHEGYLSHVKYEAGAEVPVGGVVAQLTAEPEEDKPSETAASTAKAEVVEEKPKAAEAPVAKAPPPAKKQSTVAPSTGGKVLASPKAKALLRDRGISLNDMAADGVTQPIHAAEAASYQPRAARVSSLGKISGSVNPEALISTETWLAAEGIEVSRAEILALLVADALRYTNVVESDFDCTVAVPADEFTLLNPDQLGLAGLEKLDEEDGFVCLWDFTASSIGGFELDSAAKINVSVFGGEQWTAELRFDTSLISSKQAVAFLSELTRRMTQPLRQLL